MDLWKFVYNQKKLFATAKSYLTSSLFTITYYFPKTFSDGFSEKGRVNSEKVKTFPNFVREGFCLTRYLSETAFMLANGSM
jgi:hypothetical protein